MTMRKQAYMRKSHAVLDMRVDACMRKIACHFTIKTNHNTLFPACVSEDADRSIASKIASVQIGYLKQQERAEH